MDALVGPPTGRVRVAETPDGLRLGIAGRWARKHVVVIAAAVFFVWGFAQTSAAFLVVAVALWALLAWIAPGVAFGPVGTEVILIDGATLTRWHEVAGRALGHRRFDFGQVRHIRASHVPDAPGDALYWAFRPHRRPMPQPCIAFDYDIEHVMFGIGLAEAETEQIVAAIGRRFPVSTGWPPGAEDPAAEGS